jgi:hypothetical protein
LLIQASNPASFFLPAKNQLSRLGYQLFGEPANAIQFGWVQLSADVAAIGSMSQFGWARQLTGSLPYLLPGKKFYFTRAVEGRSAYRGQSATTFLSIANPTDRPVALKLRLLGAPGTAVRQQDIILPTKGFYFAPLSAIFGLSPTLPAAFVEAEVTDGDGALGLELIRLNRQNTLIALDALYGNTFSSSYSDLLVSGPGTIANLKLINVSSVTRMVTVMASDAGGRPVAAPAQITLPAGMPYERDIEQLFALPTESILSGAIRVDAGGPGVIGDIVITETRSFGSAAGASLQTRSFTKAVFSSLGGAEDITPSLAILNSGSASVDLTIEVFAEDGLLKGGKNLQLAGGSRVYDSLVKLVPESLKLLRGYIVVTSSSPVIAHEVFVDAGQHIKSAVQPTILRD